MEIDPVDAAGETPLFYASRDGQGDVACLLLKAGADADRETPGGQFPLLAACEGGHLDVARLLLEAKSMVDRTGPDLKTPLMVASRCGYTEVVWLLLEQRASASATDVFGESAYLAACRSQKPEVVQLFTRTGIRDDPQMRSEPLLQLALVIFAINRCDRTCPFCSPCMPLGVHGHCRTQGTCNVDPQSHRDLPQWTSNLKNTPEIHTDQLPLKPKDPPPSVAKEPKPSATMQSVFHPFCSLRSRQKLPRIHQRTQPLHSVLGSFGACKT